MKKMNQALLMTSATLLLVILSNPVQAGTGDGFFADLGWGVRPTALGGAFVGIADDANALTYNPGGLAWMPRNQILFMYSSHYGMIPYGNLAYVHALGPDRGFGVGVVYGGDALAAEGTLNLGYGQTLLDVKHLRLGLGAVAKVRYLTYGNNTDGGDDRIRGNSTGFGLDAGLLAQAGPHVRAGVLVRDAASAQFWGNTPYAQSIGRPGYVTSRPTETLVGLGVTTRGRFLVAASVQNFEYLNLGLEKTLFKVFDLRVGVIQAMRKLDEGRTYSFGLGIRRLKLGPPEVQLHMDLDGAYVLMPIQDLGLDQEKWLVSTSISF